MSITISQDDESSTYSIDLLQHRHSGDRYVVKCVAEWVDDQQVGFTVVEAAGPLSQDDVTALRGDPFDWDGDPALADDINETLLLGGSGNHIGYIWEDIYAGHR